MDALLKLHTQIEQSNSHLCIGLDPRINIDISLSKNSIDKKLDSHLDNQLIFEKLKEFNKRIIDVTHTQCACYKPNIAFYEQWGVPGLQALEWTLKAIPSHIPIILDAKRGDIDATSKAYAQAAFEQLQVDAITLAPYMGIDSITPFLEYKEKLLFILVRTSNPSSDKLQLLQVRGLHNNHELYLEIAEQFGRKQNANAKDTVNSPIADSKLSAGTQTQKLSTGVLAPNLGFVVGANCYHELSAIRARYPDTWILAPGIGAQGGKIEKAINAGIGRNNSYLLPVVARAISEASNPQKECAELNKQINKAIKETVNKTSKNIYTQAVSHTTPLGSQLAQDRLHSIIPQLFETECFKIGTFTLKSGLSSPFYIDLRRIISFPELFDLVVQIYCELLSNSTFDIIAGIPSAGIPFASGIALQLQKPMIYPRIPPKPHGSGNPIEGNFKEQQTVFLIDDLISEGSSKIEAIAILKNARLVLHDVAVLICRGKHAVQEMKKIGINLHYALHIDEIVNYGKEYGFINDQQFAKIKKFLA